METTLHLEDEFVALDDQQLEAVDGAIAPVIVFILGVATGVSSKIIGDWASGFIDGLTG